jgi:flagellar FliL protein
MALFGKKKKTPAEPEAQPEDDVPASDTPVVDDESSVELKKEALAPKGGKSLGGGLVGLAVSAVAITAIALGGGWFLGKKTAAAIETAIAEREAARQPPPDHAISLKYSGDMVLAPIDAVVTNLASPSDTWIRLETAMVFKNGSIENPSVTAGEIRQDMLAYLRTVTVARLEGPSALQHLRDDLNERAALRTDGKVSELLIETLVIQ